MAIMSLSKPQRLHKPRFKDWLMDVLDRDLSADAKWCDNLKTIALIRWPHKSRGTWKLERDARLFQMWAVRSGKYHCGQDTPNPKSWKCNFRMNLNICKNIMELKDRRVTKGPNACRFFQFLDRGQQCFRGDFAPITTEDLFLNELSRNPPLQFPRNGRYPCPIRASLEVEKNLFPIEQIGTTQFSGDGLPVFPFPYPALPAPQNTCNNPHVFEQPDNFTKQIDGYTTAEILKLADSFQTDSVEFNCTM